MSKNTKPHTPRKPRPSELAAKAAREAAKANAMKGHGPAPTPKRPGRPPEERKAFDKTTMVRMHSDDYAAFEREAATLAQLTGASVSVGAYLRMAGRAMLGKHPL